MKKDLLPAILCLYFLVSIPLFAASATFYRDADGDGFGDPRQTIEAPQAPQGFVANNSDCNDEDEEVNPNAKEKCNFVDDNCDGKIDEGFTTKYYLDNDKDSYGGNIFVTTCRPDPGYVATGGDCNDADPAIFPSNPEVCDGKDNDCNGKVDDGPRRRWFPDKDGDGLGTLNGVIVNAFCKPFGYVDNCQDRDDNNKNIGGPSPECDIFLPVHFLSLNTICQGSGTQLRWETAQESNTRKFEVERSNDAITWQVVGELAAAGTSSQTTTYSFADPVPVAGSCYYRVAQHDRDGRKTYTGPMKTSCDFAGSFSVAPNPVEKSVYVTIRSAGATSVRLDILNIQGKLLQRSSFSLYAGVNQLQLDAGDLPSGIYILSARWNNTEKQTRLVKR